MYHFRDSHAALEPVAALPSALTGAELTALLPLRERYREVGDLFTAGELNRLRFLRWCHLNERLTADEGAGR